MVFCRCNLAFYSGGVVPGMEMPFGICQVLVSPCIASGIEYYSVLKLFTGLAIAALMAWKLIVIKVISNAPAQETINTHQAISVL